MTTSAVVEAERRARPVLITGALGQDGRLLAERLIADGRTVVGVVRPERQNAAAPFALVGRDIADPAAVEAMVAEFKPAAVFHIAAVHHASDAAPGADPAHRRAMTATNFAATTHFIEAIARTAPDCRLVYAASSHMYRPDATADRIIGEDDPRDPPSWYGLTKSWSMDALRFARQTCGLHASGAILFNHESPLRPEAFVSRKITRAAARIALGSTERLRLRNIGARADWFDAEDAADALARMADAPAPDDYVVGSGTASCVRDMAAAAFDAVGLDWTRHVDADADVASPTLIADSGRLRRQLGWRPRADLTTLIRRMTAADMQDLTAGAAAPSPVGAL